MEKARKVSIIGGIDLDPSVSYSVTNLLSAIVFHVLKISVFFYWDTENQLIYVNPHGLYYVHTVSDKGAGYRYGVFQKVNRKGFPLINVASIRS